MIGLLIFPSAEHKSLFYPPSLNLSRVKCLCSQLHASCVIVGVCVDVCVFCFFLHVQQNIPVKVNDCKKM